MATSSDKHTEAIGVAVGTGLAWGVLRGTVALVQGKSLDEAARVAFRSATSTAMGTYAVQVVQTTAEESGLDSESSLLAGLALGAVTKFGTRAAFDVVAPEEE